MMQTAAVEEQHIRRRREAAGICPGVGPAGLSRISKDVPGSISERSMLPERIREDRPPEQGFAELKKDCLPAFAGDSPVKISCR